MIDLRYRIIATVAAAGMVARWISQPYPNEILLAILLLWVLLMGSNKLTMFVSFMLIPASFIQALGIVLLSWHTPANIWIVVLGYLIAQAVLYHLKCQDWLKHESEGFAYRTMSFHKVAGSFFSVAILVFPQTTYGSLVVVGMWGLYLISLVAVIFMFGHARREEYHQILLGNKRFF
jgi:hypothetical protein